MPAQRISGAFVFSGVEGRRVTAAFDGGAVTSDAGARRRGDESDGWFDRPLWGCFADGREPVGSGRGGVGGEVAEPSGARRREVLPSITESDAARARRPGLTSDSGSRLPRRGPALKAGKWQRQTDLRVGPGGASPASVAADAAKVPVRSPGHRKIRGPPYPRRNMKRGPDPHPDRESMRNIVPYLCDTS